MAEHVGIATGVAAAVLLTVAWIDYQEVSDRILAIDPDFRGLASVGVGIYVVAAGGVLAAVATERMYRYWWFI